MRTKSIALLVLALGCGLVASIGITQVMANRDGDSGDSGDMVEVFVAAKPIQSGEVLKAPSVSLVKRPKDSLPEGVISSLQDVEGRVARSLIVENDLILDSRLLSDAGAEERIPKGFRVMPVKVACDTVNTGIIRPGNRVDVMVIVQLKSLVSGLRTSKTRTFLQNVKVFAVGDDYEIDPDPEQGRSRAMRTVSLLVTPEQAEMIAAASDAGTIKLTLRGADDESTPDLKGLTVQDILKVSSSNREEDESLDGPGADPKPSKLDQLEKVLAQIQQSQARAAESGPSMAQPELASTWRVQVLKGSRVDEVTFDDQGNRVGAAPRGPTPIPAGASTWQHSGSQAQPPAPGPQPTTPPEEQTPTDEPVEDD